MNTCSGHLLLGPGPGSGVVSGAGADRRGSGFGSGQMPGLGSVLGSRPVHPFFDSTIFQSSAIESKFTFGRSSPRFSRYVFMLFFTPVISFSMDGGSKLVPTNT